MSKFTVIDLFSGAGGLSKGFLDAGYDVVLGIDFDDSALKTFENNHGSAKALKLDLFNLDNVECIVKEFNKKHKSLDVLVGGPPCQGFSLAGKREEDDKRNTLYKAMVKLAERMKPRAVVLENVPGMLTLYDGAGKKRIFDDFEKLGYKMSVKVLYAPEYGVPQIRKRAFFVGLLNSKHEFEFPEPILSPEEFITCEDAIGDLPALDGIYGDEVQEYECEPKTRYQAEMRKNYTELFNLENSEIANNFNGKSKFVILDFNGEYVSDGIFRCSKKCLNLSTRKISSDKLPITPKTFWDIETLSILYSATEKTQRPFLSSAVKYFVDDEKYDITVKKIINGLGSAFFNTFKQNNNKEMLSLLNKSLEIIGLDINKEYKDDETDKLLDLSWLGYLWNSYRCTYYKNEHYINSVDDSTILDMRGNLENILRKSEFIETIENLTVTEKLKIAVNSHLIYCLAYGKVNYDHISPLIHRIEARSNFIEKTLCISESPDEWQLLNVISFRNCNSEAKKMIPLLIAKQLYEEHKERISEKTEINSTLHLIIDEAHNILSAQSTREEESWKDYRLEIFEEIIKEGRKFGFFITLASQRPYDISPTIISQLHNYFIHRLVNEQDLRMIANTVNSLDSISRNQIPNLAPGQCIITGTSFEMPLLIQVIKLPKDESPTSENADLVRLWIREEG